MSRRLRPDCWVGTGKNALENLHRLIEFHLSRDAEFLTLGEFYHEYQKLKREGEL